MSRRPAAVVMLLAAGTASLAACNLVRPSEPAELDPDVIAVQAVIFAGSSSPHAIVGFPHRAGGPPPSIGLELWAQGSGPRIGAFDMGEACDPSGRGFGVYTCVSATLPAPLQSGMTYRLVAVGPGGVIEGTATVPEPPVIVSPARDTVIEWDGQFLPIATIDLTVEAPAAVHMFAVAVSDLIVTPEDGPPRLDCAFFEQPARMRIPVQDVVRLEFHSLHCSGFFQPWNEITFLVRLVGFDAAYASFAAANEHEILHGTRSFGITGAAGVFAGAAGSEPLRITIR